jgi:hypothetical protein
LKHRLLVFAWRHLTVISLVTSWSRSKNLSRSFGGLSNSSPLSDCLSPRETENVSLLISESPYLLENVFLNHPAVSRPHLGSTRKIHPGQKIHSSLLLSKKVYSPKARTPEGDTTFWDRLRKEEGFKRKWVEFDLYEHAANVMDDFIVDPDKASHTLRIR